MNAVGSYPTISPLPGQGSRKTQAFGGMFSVALMSDCSAWALPSTLPSGVRTFLSFPSPNENERSPHPLHDSMNNNRPFWRKQAILAGSIGVKDTARSLSEIGNRREGVLDLPRYFNQLRQIAWLFNEKDRKIQVSRSSPF